MVSRVVPAISLTMALFSFKSALSSVDLPAFGFPIIATCTPFFMTFPNANESTSCFVALCKLDTNLCNAERSAKATSSSEKSSSNSMRAENVISCSRSAAKSVENPPRIV